MMTPTLETPRLTLRPLRLGDAPRMQALFPHYELVKHMTAKIPWPFPEDGSLTYLQSYLLPAIEKGEAMAWALTLKSAADDQLIGLITLEDIHEAPSADKECPTRGFWLGLEYHKQGLMSEAIAPVMAFAFAPTPLGLGLTAIFVDTAQPNLGSSRIKEREGGELVARRKRAYVGGTFPSALWKITP